MKRLILLLAIVFLVAGLRAASVLPVGEGKFTYKDYPPFTDRPVDVHYYIPASGDVRRMPIVFVFEGADRGYRLSTLRDADRLVVMDEGRITEEGSHEELLARKGTYFKLRELQTKALAMRGLE